ncbi:hypothetical protein PHMEG_00037176, partial [Phytophthora megakarya]
MGSPRLPHAVARLRVAATVVNSIRSQQNNLRPSNICTELTAHNKRSQLLSCNSKTCATASPYARCPWRGKLETCEELKIVTLAEIGAHITHVRSPQSPRLTASMKTFARDLAIQGLNPSRIRMMRRFDLDMRTLPKLSTVQRYVGNYKRHHLGFNDFHELFEDKVKAAAYIGGEEDKVGFTFGWRETVNGMPHFGKGTDEDPFILGITSNRCNVQVELFLLSCLVIGVTDRLRTLHLLALFIVSQRIEPVYVEVLASLHRAFFRVVGVPLKVNFLMTDAEAAMHSAFEGVFASDNSYTQLMCWYHVVAKVYQHTNKLSTTAREVAMADVFAMHFVRGQTDFNLLKQAALKRWTCNLMLVHFASYFSKVWLPGKATRWQCYWTPGGFAKTNNPCEQFNKVPKRDYTHRRCQKVGALITLLLSCCSVESMKVAPFCQTPGAQTQLKSRTREMIRAGKVFEYVPKRSSIAFFVDDPLPPAADGVVRVSQLLAL